MLLTTRFPATVGLRPRRQGAAGRARPPAEPFCAEGPDLLNRARGANGSPGGSPSRVSRARGAIGSPGGSPPELWHRAGSPSGQSKFTFACGAMLREKCRKSWRFKRKARVEELERRRLSSSLCHCSSSFVVFGTWLVVFVTRLRRG